MQFADRLQAIETSAIRELFKLLGKPGIISFAGGFPDPALFDVAGIQEASAAVLANNPGPVLHMAQPKATNPCASPSAPSWPTKAPVSRRTA
jgi:DNA-binding transcriptional MocR family regulator